MDIEQYIKHFKKQPWKQTGSILQKNHNRIGEIFVEKTRERDRMEVDRPNLIIPQAQSQEFMF